MKKYFTVFIILFVLITSISLVFASTATNVLNVSANAVASCFIGVSPVVFGDFTTGVYNATGSVDVLCQAGLPYHITLDGGSSPGGINPRLLSSQNSPVGLPYFLYKDSTLTDQWGDSDFANTYPPGSSVAGTGTGIWQGHTVYGKLTVEYLTEVGLYKDVVNITVHW